jgi:hypothetical protein
MAYTIDEYAVNSHLYVFIRGKLTPDVRGGVNPLFINK